MKTVLYKPIFINPQAYAVFPQLYDLQPNRDNYLEYAVFSGRLIVKDVNDESDQLTFKNTKEIDLSSFMGKTIEIDQYTDTGNTVLGRFEIVSAFHPSLVDAWFMSGISNADNPSFIKGIKGNKLWLKNFAYALSSGFGKYEVDFNQWRKEPGVTVSAHSITITGIRNNNWIVLFNPTAKVKGFRVKVEGIREDVMLTYRYYAIENDTATVKNFTITEDGVYSLPETEASTNAVGFYCYSPSHTGYDQDIFNGLTITQLPSDYEGALVFDGVDDYAVCDDSPILTDYTLICRRVIEETEGSNYVIASKNDATRNGAFVFEQKYNNIYGTHSFGRSSLYTPSLQDSVIFQSTENYNGKVIVRGTSVDTDKLYIGCLMYAVQCMKGAIYYFALYNKSLTAEEIEQEKVKLAKVWEDRL